MNRKDIVTNLRHPMWAHGNVPFQSPQLDKESVVADMNAAADLIDALVKALEEMMMHWEKCPMWNPKEVNESVERARAILDDVGGVKE